MGKRRKQEVKLDTDEAVGGEVLPLMRPEAVDAVSSDDEEANEDLSLKIVEKALLMRAAKLVPGPIGGVVSNDDDTDVSEGTAAGFDLETIGKGGGSEEDVEEKRGELTLQAVEGREQVGSELFLSITRKITAIEDEGKEEAVGAMDAVNSVDPNAVEITDNIVLRKLLRGPRYFDPPGNNSWGVCYTCSEEGHAAANCSQKRRRPCFVCGSLEHNVKDCSKSSCFICKSGGHRAKNCPEKKKRVSQNDKICLKCGESGHDMFHCENDYSPEDIKEIQCYVCKSFGHLCCLNSVATDSIEISCYKCGMLGHTGAACGRARAGNQGEPTPGLCYNCGEAGHFSRECKGFYKVSTSTVDGTPSLCYKCGQGGHFARDCTVSSKHKSIERLSASLTERRKLCSKCGEEGHYARKCHLKNKGEAPPSSCRRCGQEGHFARTCRFSSQSHKRDREPSTPPLRSYDEGQDYYGGLNSPSSSKKSSTRRKNQDTDGSMTCPRKTKQIGGWVSENPGALKLRSPMKNNSSMSPATQAYGSGRFYNSQSPGKPNKFQYGDNSHTRFSASRFGNSTDDSTRRNRDWW